MTKKVLITGNGFDVYHGLPTLYYDVIEILNFVSKKENKISFENVYENCKEKSKKIKNTYKSFDFDDKKIELLREKLDKNLWYNFFSNELKINTWVDFENRIDYVLRLINDELYRVYHIEKKMGVSSFSVFNYPSGLCLEKENEVRQDSITALRLFKVIIGHRSKPVALMEDVIPKKYLIQRGGGYIGVDFEKIFNDLFNELNDFREIFKLYFEIFVFPLYNNLKNEFEIELFEKIDYHFTFNYTPTFEKFYNKNLRTEFLHGQAESETVQIVLGTNKVPDSKLDDRYYIPFTKGYQKLYHECDIKFLSVFDQTSNFYFFGHSLDTSDKYYIDAVFDYLKRKLENDSKYNGTNKITIFYHSESSKANLIINLISIRGEEEIVSLKQEKALEFIRIDTNNYRKSLNEVIKDKEIVAY
ncbi:AbiH family protein [Tenacibaculum sp. C7A-26P2]|uniref:AbiH family protein n=1 Tax=Tenacibaculum sp. C7A-26P2 TaxID=3447504 RepID=UPI003F84089D